jgi:hypothetical protein
MGPHSGGRGSEQLRSSYAAGLDCRAEGEASGLLCPASSIPSGRLRDVEVHRADSEGSVDAQELRIRHVGWRDPSRISSLSRERVSRRSIGAPAASLTRIWICSSRSTTSIGSSSSDASRIPASKRPFAMPLSSATTSRWVKDATADYSDEAMHAALDINIPNYASAVVTTNEIVDLIVQTLGSRAP